MDNKAYRADIDGLRAIAVLAVIAYHYQVSCPGGFVGVDVFFVISGYLISSILFRELDSGKFSFLAFCERRIRRIFPASCLVAFVSLVAGAFLLLPRDFEVLGMTAIFQTLMAANVYLWKSGGYFEGALDENPLMHYWSLAVEEQFYILLPLVLIIIYRFKLNRRFLGAFIILGALVSLVAATTLVFINKSHVAFYLLPARAWELLLGAIILFLPLGLVNRWRWFRECIVWIGLALVVVPVFMYNEETKFPGLTAIPPCLGAAMIIYGNTPSKRTLLGRLLSLPPLVFIGLISYSLYLWHWPIWVYAKYWIVEDSMPLWAKCFLVVLSATVAILTWKYVEAPFRRKNIMSSKKAILSFAALCSFFVFSSGLVIKYLDGAGGRFETAISANDLALKDYCPAPQMYKHHFDDNKLYQFGAISGNPKPAFILWGDSHAMHLLPALDAACKDLNIKGEAATHTSTPPLVNAVYYSDWGLNEGNPEFAERLIQYVKARGIKNVVLAAYWSSYQTKNRDVLKNAFPITISRLKESGCNVIVFMDVPAHEAKIPKVIAKSLLFGTEVSPWLSSIEQHRGKNSEMYDFSQNSSLAKFVDLSTPFISDSKRSFRVDVDGVSVYRDSNHLSNNGSKIMLTSFLRHSLSECLIK